MKRKINVWGIESTKWWNCTRENQNMETEGTSQEEIESFLVAVEFHKH